MKQSRKITMIVIELLLLLQQLGLFLKITMIVIVLLLKFSTGFVVFSLFVLL